MKRFAPALLALAMWRRSLPTKVCPRCHQQMIERSTGIIQLTYPPQFPMEWWCGCGHREYAETVSGTTVDDIARRDWEEANTSLGRHHLSDEPE